MKTQLTTSTSPTALFILIFFYILLIILILVFSQQIISSIQYINPFANSLIILIMFLVPSILLIIIIFNIIKLLRERAKNRPGSRLKTRLILFFVFIALLSLIPQALLSISFINSSINFWFSVKIIDVLDGGLSVALKSYQDKNDNLRKFSRSPHLSFLLKDIEKKPNQLLANVRNANPEISFIQVFSSGGNEILYEPDQEEGRITSFSEIKGQTGLLPKKETKNFSILRSISEVTVTGKVYFVVFGIRLPKEFSEYASRITSSRSKFKQLEIYKDIFRIVVIIFYFLFSLPIFLLAILISFLLTDEIIRPIVHLEEATRRISEGDFSFRILSRSNDELTILVDSFNRMLSELELSRKKLLHTEKIAAWQEIARRLAHEIKNPLTPIKLSAQRLMKKYIDKNEDFDKILKSATSAIIKEVENLNNLLKEFREFSRFPELKIERISIKNLINEVTSIFKESSPEIKINIDISNDNDFISCDATQMKQVIMNLIKNAIQAMPEGGEIIIRGDWIKKGFDEYFRLQMKDTGIGIENDVKDNVFDPYFTTKKDGTGLGLSIVEKIIFNHNGNIWFESEKNIGTTFFIDLPI